MIIDPEFKKQIAYMDLASIKNSNDVICIVDADMKLRAYNRAWQAFAMNNGGEDIVQKYPLGISIADVGEEPVKSFIKRKYREAMALNKMFGLDYECSSKQVFRLFRLTAYPLLNKQGLVISHHLVKQCPHTDKSMDFNKQFVNREGMIVQCINCRKVRDPNNMDRWLWVPSLLEQGCVPISHGICDRCLDHYYPDIG
jgi:hypothetical protein